jgi:hypothetical protein
MPREPRGAARRIASILTAGAAAGDLRPDVSADDVVASRLGTFSITGARTDQAGRLLDLLVDGLRAGNARP